MASAEDFDTDEALARWLFEQWDDGRGRAKSALELEVWGDATSHGRRFDRVVRGELGISTTKPSKQTNRIQVLERQIRGLGAHPIDSKEERWEVSLRHARASCLEALRVWNDPSCTFRTGAFSLLFVTAWNALAIALLERRGELWWDLSADPGAVSLPTRDLISAAIVGSDAEAVRRNIGFWIDIRNAVAHRHLPAVDATVNPWAQAGLLVFEEAVDEEFGPEYCLGGALSVPLQLSGFRDPGVLASQKKLQSGLPVDVQALLADARSVPEQILNDPRYMMRVAFVPYVPSSGRNPDSVAHFFRPGEVPSELDEALERYVVLQKITGSSANLRATHVVAEVQRRTGYKFNTNLHAEAARRLDVRPPRGEQDKTLKIEYAELVTAFNQFAYTQAWIDLLVEKLSDPESFERTTGKPARRVAAGADSGDDEST